MQCIHQLASLFINIYFCNMYIVKLRASILGSGLIFTAQIQPGLNAYQKKFLTGSCSSWRKVLHRAGSS